ncbi:MAG: 4Fe-4S binding protein [Desulforhabdus sp.]|jgi:ferredoxin|nr:4Fe-4S binding protein [Desulforhabdus sp.]
MCQFCHKHGEGKKWYLQAENYSNELLSDMGRRQYIKGFVSDIGNCPVSKLDNTFRQAMKAPSWLRHLLYRFNERRYRRDHFGQVVPLEELEEVLDLANSIVLLPCVCRKSTTGRRDANYCIGLGLDPEKLLDVKEAFLETFRPGPEVKLFEKLSKAEAIKLHKKFERDGLIHTIWTFKTPFIGAICNCDRADCLAMHSYRYELRLFFRGEYIGEIDEPTCIGCRACLAMCQFGAIGFSVDRRKAFIDPVRCYGCGVCRSVCEQGAIQLTARSEHPLARNLW